MSMGATGRSASNGPRSWPPNVSDSTAPTPTAPESSVRITNVTVVRTAGNASVNWTSVIGGPAATTSTAVIVGMATLSL